MNTLDALIQKHGGPVARLDEVAEGYLGISSRKAGELAAGNRLPIPAHKLGSQKSPWMVNLADLADLIDRKAQEARTDWEESQ